VVEEVMMLKQQPGMDILLAGSADLLHTLMQADVVDEYRLMLHPVVVGNGKRLFREDNAMKVMKLMSTKAFASGIVILSYAPARAE
jgi:dihydrofolate reductase